MRRLGHCAVWGGFDASFKLVPDFARSTAKGVTVIKSDNNGQGVLCGLLGVLRRFTFLQRGTLP
jgi:hypothetical protein